MARLECDFHRAEGVTLVELTLESDFAERVELEPTHDGPLWPPRRQGVPERGWSADGWAGVVPADEPLALGYATPADPDDPPVRIADSGPPPDEPTPASPRDVLRVLGDPRPPGDAVEPGGTPEPGSAERAANPAATAADADRPAPPRTGSADLDPIEDRIDRAASLTAVDSAPAAREAVEAAGGVDAVIDLAEQLDRDRERLAALEERAAGLRERADLDVPLEDLARLA